MCLSNDQSQMNMFILNRFYAYMIILYTGNIKVLKYANARVLYAMFVLYAETFAFDLILKHKLERLHETIRHPYKRRDLRTINGSIPLKTTLLPAKSPK